MFTSTVKIGNTYGPKPRPFDMNGEKYYIGADVGAFLKCHRGTLYKKYPLLWKRLATQDEKKIIAKYGSTTSYLSSNIMLVKYNEVEEIFDGQEDKYRSGGLGANGNETVVRQESVSAILGKPRTQPVYANSQVSSGTHHLESIPCSMPASGGHGKIRQREHIYSMDTVTHADALIKNARQPEELVPIRLDMDIDGHRLRDTFCYNKNETIITPEMVAEIICEDLDLPPASFQGPIAASIQQQIDAHRDIIPLEGTTDQRAIMKLNIHVGNESLTDTFEWDISNKDYTPEEFARKLCTDLSIGGEFEGAIAYSIRGQIAWNQRTFAYSEAPLPKIENPFRNPLDMDNWMPTIEILSDAEVEKKMRDQDRNTRRMRRLVNANPYGNL
uniref:SWI/SNF-related matrix-associated actin-dependent regulator of chromatin subfamily B member 1 n=1 Tax=Panagrellus redivivus TaxID=6233 RepID=A0A7E4VAI5_PANRE